ncbi:MAG: dihydropteroate synthase [Microthrixaceae bacterium]
MGERTNTNGSKAFREAMIAGDWDSCVQMAKDQVAQGAHILDVCVDYVGRDGTADMDEIASRFATQASVPLVLDSTEPEVMEAGLVHLGGRAILNSANLEDGEEEGKRLDRVFTLAKTYGAAVICLLIDEEGQARDTEWKMRVAHRIHDLATQRYGLEPEDLIFDALTFPLSTGDDDLRRDAMATIEAIRRIHSELPGVHDPRRLQCQLRPETRSTTRAQQRLPPRMHRSRPRFGDRACGEDPPAQPDSRGATRRLHGPDLRPPRIGRHPVERR